MSLVCSMCSARGVKVPMWTKVQLRESTQTNLKQLKESMEKESKEAQLEPRTAYTLYILIQ